MGPFLPTCEQYSKIFSLVSFDLTLIMGLLFVVLLVSPKDLTIANACTTGCFKLFSSCLQLDTMDTRTASMQCPVFPARRQRIPKMQLWSCQRRMGTKKYSALARMRT